MSYVTANDDSVSGSTTTTSVLTDWGVPGFDAADYNRAGPFSQWVCGKGTAARPE